MNNSFIYIAGTDGSGKTTLLKDIEKRLLESGLTTHHIWLRSPKIFSKPLMLYCRLTGLTKYKIIDGIKYGKHEFYRSRFVSWLFPYLQLIDFKIKWKSYKKKIDKDSIVMFDRFALDTLADLMVDTGRMDLHKSRVGRKFIKYIPQNTNLYILDVKPEIIRHRKKDTLFDEHLEKKIEVYKLLAQDLNVPLIDNSGAYNQTLKVILNSLEIYARN